MKQVISFFYLVLIVFSVDAQITLSGTNYSQNFDGVGSGLPSGFRVSSSATAATLGTAATFNSAIDANSPWNSTFSGWKNVASADGLISSSNAATQAASTDRVVGIRQSSSLGDPGAALEMQLANTTGFSDFSMSFKLQSLDATSARITTWRVDYGFGASPSSFTTIATSPASITTGGGTFSNNTVTVDFGTALDNINQNVWIRIVTISATTLSGSRATTGFDDISLDFSIGSGCTPPATQALAVSFSSVTSSSFDINWTPGSGSNSLVVIKAGSAINGTPSNGIAYTANAVYGAGQIIASGEYVVYNGTGNTVTVTGLSTSIIYHVAVFSFDNTGSCYNAVNPAAANVITACGQPVIQVSTISTNASLTSASLNWSGGSGTNALVKINTSNSFTAPLDGVTYSTNTLYSGGEQVIYNGTGTAAYVTGLLPGTNYYVTIYTYNSCGSSPDYLVTGNPVQPFTTLLNNNIPANYYNTASGLSCAPLKTELRNIINTGLTHQSYGDLWTIYQTADVQPSELASGNVIWDIYSDDPAGPDPYEFTPVSDQCGGYSGEGDCYNREHSFPQSWFVGGTSAGPGTDYHHIFPTDGHVNGQRSNYPYGSVGTATYTSFNGSKLGSSNWTGVTGTVFEPINEYKGDVARAFLYMVTCYQNSMPGWESLDVSGDVAMDGTLWPSVEPSYLQLMISWHNSDPVSQKEIDRNNAGYTFQGNRNPFVDHPEYVEMVWSGLCYALPVNIISFTGKLQGSFVELNWTIANAENFGQFVVERSVNGGLSYEEIGEVEYRQNFSAYSYTDNVSLLKGEVLYRLKMVNLDGSSRYSKVIRLSITGINRISLYPNPATDQLYVAFYQPTRADYTVWIADMSGRKIFTKLLPAGQLNYQLPVSSLPAGPYLLSLHSPEQVIFQKFIKK